MTQTWQLPSAQGSREESDDSIETRLHARLIRDIDETVLRGLDTERQRELVEQAARSLIGEVAPGTVGELKEEAVQHVVDEVLGLGPIEPLLRDPRISEVMVNAPDEVYYEQDGIIYEAETRFRDNAHVMRVIDRIVSGLGRRVDEASPMVDARLADGSRVNAIIPPLVPRSPVLTIRKFRRDRMTMDDLIKVGTLPDHVALLLEACVKAKISMVISGGTGSGKTTFLNALSASLSERERIVTIEDPLELRLQQRHVISMEARPPSLEGKGEVTQRDLVRNALRMRPDRIIVGEVRGTEAFDMMQAMNTGHEGSLTTVHANSPRDALSRIENMVMMAHLDMPVTVIREQLASAVQVIIQLARMTDGSRRLVALSEVTGMEGHLVSIQDIFAFKQTGVGADGQVFGDLRPMGVRPKFAERLQAFGHTFEQDVFGTARWG